MKNYLFKNEKLCYTLTLSFILLFVSQNIFAGTMTQEFAQNIGEYLQDFYGIVKIVAGICAGGCLISIGIKLNKDNHHLQWEVIGLIIFIGIIFAVPALVNKLSGQSLL